MRNNNNQHLHIFVDTESIDKSLSNSDPNAQTFLSYSGTRIFKFIRSPYDTKYEILRKIRYYELEKDTGSNTITGIKISNYNDRESWILFSSNMDVVNEFAKITFKKALLAEDEKEALVLVLVHCEFMISRFYEGKAIFVTENKKLLRNRAWLQARLSPKLEITTIAEAMSIMDLFAKTLSYYYIRPNVIFDKKGWYWFSFRSKVSHYHVPNRGPFEQRSVLEAFASRFTYLLLAIDEIGIQYLLLKDKDILIPYHFNYFISLVTGVFDNLAIVTRERCQIKLENDHPSRTSLSNSAGKEFLKELKSHVPNLGIHIDNYREFISLIYKLREVSIHREGFSDIGHSQNAKFTLYLKIDANVESLVKQCGDKRPFNESLSNWGITKHSIFTLLEPYHFAKAAGSKLAIFSDEYLRLLGFSKFVYNEQFSFLS